MTPKSIPGVAPRRLRLIGIIAALAAIGLAVYGIADRAKSSKRSRFGRMSRPFPPSLWCNRNRGRAMESSSFRAT
jgi:hypothetical protein